MKVKITATCPNCSIGKELIITKPHAIQATSIRYDCDICEAAFYMKFTKGKEPMQFHTHMKPLNEKATKGLQKLQEKMKVKN